MAIIRLILSGIVHYCSFRKPCSGYKMKEMTGSGIFAAAGANGASETTAMNSTNKTGLRMYQVSV